MPAAARLGDSISHGGAITSASPDHVTDGIPTARLGDSAVCAIHGGVTIVAGSGFTKVNGRPRARVGDAVSCGAVISSGSGATQVA
jgi:uncharacterized Zn-binding protein involved in type VI secretion